MYKLTGKGAALVFQDGKVIKGYWNRTKHDERDIYTDIDGNQISFVRGQIWVQVVPVGQKINYGRSDVNGGGSATN